MQHTTRRQSARFRRLVAKLSEDQRAQLDGLEVRQSGFGEWLEAGGERRQRPDSGGGRRRRVR